MIFRVGCRVPRWAAAVVLASLVALLAGACGPAAARSNSAGGSGSSARLTNAAGTKAAVNAWVGHVVSFDAVDPTTIGKVETGFALQADRGLLAYDQSRGAPENQYQPTGNVAWVAIPPKGPTLSELARIETNYKPVAGSTVPAASNDNLAVLERKSTRAPWLISNWVYLHNPSPDVVHEVRTLGNPLSSAAAAKLPIPAQTLPNAYLSYLGGGDGSKFSPGPFTDQSRNVFDSTKAGWSAVDVSFSYQYSQGSVQGVYALGGGDALVFFGIIFSEVFQAGSNTCLQQIASRPQFPVAVSPGRYQSITLQSLASALAIENPRDRTVSIITSSLYEPVKAATTPTTAAACL